MAKVIGCIGCGTMGSAILAGFGSVLDKNEWELTAVDPIPGKLDALAEAGVKRSASIEELVSASDLIIIAVKPDQVEGVLAKIKNPAGKIVLSIAAGIGLSVMRNALGIECRISRCMPTTTARVKKGVFAFCFDPLNFEREWADQLVDLFAKIGICVEIPENKFTDFSAYIGAAPAYIFGMMHALTQAGITIGFPTGQSREMLDQLFEGCAILAKQEVLTPFIRLRDAVCSPAGLTIAGVNVLDRAGFTGLMVDAVLAARERGKEMEN